jgi:hypothetical protein
LICKNDKKCALLPCTNEYTFNEFLKAVGENKLLDAMQRANPEKPLSELVHKKALNCIIGGENQKTVRPRWII